MADEEVPLKVKFEYLNAKKENVYSKEYVVPIVLEEGIQVNQAKIYNFCEDFQTKEDRINYQMFDPELLIFLTKTEELKKFVNNKKTVVMKNCTVLAKQIIEILRDEKSRYMLGKNINLSDEANDELLRVDTLSLLDDKKKNKILITVFNLK